MEPVSALQAHELYRFFHTGDDETLALCGVSFAVAPGELLAITGPSGSGKSTLLACLAGIDEPDGGWVSIAGRRLSRRPELERARLRARSIGMLMQSGNLLDHLTVLENLELAMALVERGGRSRITELLHATGITQRAAALPSELSGGEAARAGLALALINNPAVLLADEPTGEVDAANEAAILRLLRERAETGGATLVVTHSPAVAAAADRVIRLEDGRLRDA